MNELLPVINGMKLIALFPSYSYSDYVAVARDLETDRYHVVTWWEGETYWCGVRYDIKYLRSAMDWAQSYNEESYTRLSETEKDSHGVNAKKIRDAQHVPSPDSSVMKEVV